MASDFQRQVLQRKLIYAGLIVALFSATLFYRPYVLEAHANSLGLREENQGDVNPLGAAVRLTLTGSRGFALCVLWQMAIEKQKRHEWNELEILVDAIAQLQPHFATPWLFQSWNFAYNVSAECDSVGDKYFWISRGIGVAAAGVRQNLQNPDLRAHVGYYYMDKIGWADQRRMLRTLVALSCIDPKERDPANLRRPDGKVDVVKFRVFCEEHPHVARRLKEMHGCRTPDEAVKFLGDHWEIPARYETAPPGTSLASGRSKLKAPEQQFPILPRPADILPGTEYEFSADQHLPSGFDNYSAAVVWYAYAQEWLPPPSPVPGPPSRAYDRMRYRMPRAPRPPLFSSFAARAQTFYARNVQRDGWFDHGWEIDAGQTGSDRWFAEKVVVGDRPWSTSAWTKARDMWEQFGRSHGIHMAQAEVERLQELAKKYRDAFSKGPLELDPKATPADFEGGMRASFEAHAELYWYNHYRKLIHFGPAFAEATAQSDSEAVQARELFYQARQKRKAAALDREIMDIYARAFPIWERVLRRHRDFRKDQDVQEFTYRQQMRYFDVLLETQNPELKKGIVLQDWLEEKRVDLKKLVLVIDLLGQGAVRPPLASCWLPPGHCFGPGKLIELPRGPFDALDNDGQPFFSREAIERATKRIDPDEVN